MSLLPFVSSHGEYCVPHMSEGGSVAWPAANRIIYVPARIPEDCTVLRVFWMNGDAVSGTANMGLYDSDGVKLWECGATTQAGTRQLQFVDIADQDVSAGLYYMALQESGNTGRMIRQDQTYYSLAAGVMTENAGSFALPGTATFAKAASGYLPAFGLDLRGTL